MSKLDMFLELPDVTGITKEIDAGKRLGKVKIGALSSDEYAEIMKKSRKMNTRKGTVEFDDNTFNLNIASSKLLEPDFSNAEFLAKANCSTAKEFMSRKLLPGEIREISNKILELSGFDTDINDDIEEAKN